jgi:hypothetical protein
VTAATPRFVSRDSNRVAPARLARPRCTRQAGACARPRHHIRLWAYYVNESLTLHKPCCGTLFRSRIR